MRQRGIVCVNQLKSVSQTSFIQLPEFPDVVGVRLPRPRLVFALLAIFWPLRDNISTSLFGRVVYPFELLLCKHARVVYQLLA